MNLTPTNWQAVQATLTVALKPPIACKGEYKHLVEATTFNAFFEVLFSNYEWLKHNYGIIAKIENITPIQHSAFMVWLLETYCLGKGVDSVVQAVIDLHKQRLNGLEPTEEQWATAMATATAAARDAATAAARAAATAAASDAARATATAAARAAATAAARDAAMSAARAAAMSAARDAAMSAARAAAWDAAMSAARDAAMSAAREQISNKLIEIIYE